MHCNFNPLMFWQVSHHSYRNFREEKANATGKRSEREMKQSKANKTLISQTRHNVFNEVTCRSLGSPFFSFFFKLLFYGNGVAVDFGGFNLLGTRLQHHRCIDNNNNHHHHEMGLKVKLVLVLIACHLAKGSHRSWASSPHTSIHTD
jgi:hypothetical protein